MIDRFVEVPPHDPDAPETFRFAAPGKLVRVLEIERRLNFQIEAPISFEQFWQLRTEMSGTLRDKIARIMPTERPTVKHAVAEAVRRYFVSGTMSFAAEALIVSGRDSAG